MKRVLAITLTLLLLLGVLSSCSLYRKMFGYDTEYTGPVYNMYFGERPTSLDPADAYLNDAAIAVMSQIYEGLYRYDEKGNVVPALAKECKKLSFDETTGELEIEITIRDSRWNDHIYVQAEQFIFAWRRILDPASSSPAASLLYDIKNAKEVKTATDMNTKYDLGVTAVETRVLHIILQGQKLEDGTYAEPSVNAFKEKLASPLLVPVRSDKISKLQDWAATSDTIAANGPYYLRTFTQNENLENGKESRILLQRNVDYLRDDEVDPLDTYVKPYQILIRFSVDQDAVYDATGKLTSSTPIFSSSAEQAVSYYEHGYLDYLAYIPLSMREQYKDKVTLSDALFTHTYLFDTSKPLFMKPEVRRALSMALDRSEIASRLVYAKPAHSIVTSAAKEPGGDDAFIDHLTNGVRDTAQFDEAKKLLESAGVTGGSFTIGVKANDENAAAAAEYCKEVWTKLGFDVSVRILAPMIYINAANNYTGIYDNFVASYLANGQPFNQNPPGKLESVVQGFDVLAIDLFTNSTDPFTTYAPFSKNYSGMALDMTQEVEQFEPSLPLTSYDSNRYNACIDAAFKTPVKGQKAAYLHAADEQLMNDMPVMPLVYVQNSVLTNPNLRDLAYSVGGVPDFKELTCKNYTARTLEEMQQALLEEYKKNKE